MLRYGCLLLLSARIKKFGCDIIMLYICYMFIMKMIRTMNTSITLKKKQTAFRFSEDLLERLKELAKKDNRSLNNYVEKILIEKVYNEPNETTIAAMKEAKERKNLETLDLAKFKEFIASL